MKRMGAALLLAGVCAPCFGQGLTGLCMVTAADHTGSSHVYRHGEDTADVMLHRADCDDETHGGCGTEENSNIEWGRWTGVTREALGHEGAVLDASMRGEAGELKCSGTVHDGVLAGRFTFTPDAGFVAKMKSMGFDEISLNKQEGMLMLDVSTEWVRQMKAAGVTEMSTGKLMGLRALGVDAEYMRAMAAEGFPETRAGKLTSMKAVGVTPEKAKEAKAMGFEPSEDDLVQMSVFHVDKAFVERMRARGLKDLTLHKLIQIKIFKLDE